MQQRPKEVQRVYWHEDLTDQSERTKPFTKGSELSAHGDPCC